MDEVIGAPTDPDSFDRFLDNWETVLPHRVDEAVATFTKVPGICGLILAGSVGRGEAWPLSDIDLLPIYDDDLADEARDEVERLRTEPRNRWIREGWWTGLDIGTLVFTYDEVAQAFQADEADVIARLQDNRWYHSIDKGYRGRAVYDPTGYGARLVQWFTDERFRPEVVRFRLTRERGEVEQALQRLHACRANQDVLRAIKSLWVAVHWLPIWLMERWGERDNSLARFGTRFERVARARGRHDLIDQINALSDLDDANAERHLAAAPWWVWERHDRQWRARRKSGEDVARAEDLRDVLRVCTHYGLRDVMVLPCPSWLAIPDNFEALDSRTADLSALARQCFTEDTPSDTQGTS